MSKKPRPTSHRTSWFTRFAQHCARWAGQPVTFAAAVGLLVLWGISGPIFGFSDTWQLIINTSTTIVTFLMVFLIQNTQNRDTEALQIKLDELIRATRSANNSMLDLEKLEEAELDRIRDDYERLAEKARSELTNRKSRRRKSD
ncbi:MAG: hypothetical protein BGO12_12180 [Verrucomicrobia bacterium 61-8]|nr:low affinity iron permease family protein [Verrucomicrobiota bacterium]OJV15174.1 MAG: hypothetical protein BGO12_12180 [Verrucomicrobia bacterium 61-8]